MSATASPLVDVADIVRMVGRLAFDRGRGYARTGMVIEVDWDPATERVSGRVQGTGPLPYDCHVSLGAQVNGFAKLLRSDCTCPVTGDCKHVAALLLSSNAARLREEGSTDRWTLPAGGMPGGGSSGGSGAEPTTGRVRPDFAVRPHDADPFDFSSARAMTGWAEDPLPEPEPPTWRTVVGALAAKPDAGRTVQSTTMGLQFEVRQLVPRTAERWRGPTTATAAGEPEPGQTRRLAVRPVIKNSSGNFVKANVTWASFAHQVNRLGLDPEHHRWFSQFAALHRSTRGAYTGHESDWFFLDDFASPILWHLLQEAHRIGVALVATRKGTVHIGREAGVRLDALIDAEGAIRLSPVVSIDGEHADAAMTGAIGDHGLYSYRLTPRAAITIAPMEGRLSEQQRALLGPTEPTVVPPAEIEEFLTDFVPRLRRSIELTSVDGSLPLPAVVPPVLVLTAGYGPKHTLQLDWSWLYAPDQRVPFAEEGASVHDAPDDDVLHDERTERTIVERVGEALGAAALAAETEETEETVDAPGTDDVLQTGQDGAAQPATDSRPGASAALLGVRARRITPTISVPWPPEGRTILRGVDAAVFTERILPVIESVDGVRVEIVGTRPEYRELIGDPELTITTVESDKRDWFDLGIVVNLAGYRIPFGPLFKALSKRAKKLLMVDNTYLSLQHPAFDRLRELLDEADALREWETGPRISRYQASLWDDFEDLADETVQAVAWRESVAGLTDLTAVPATPLPNGLVADLRPYQLDGYHWLAFLWKHRLGGVLADDMGLGKTLQALAMMARAREEEPTPTPTPSQTESQDAPAARPPFLVVAPTSVVGNWLVEAARFTPGLIVRAMTTTEANGKETIADVAEGADIVVTSYTLFRLDAEVYREEQWAGLILDEAQFVKNHRAKLHECAAQIDTPFKLAITGTPLENNLMELWSLFAIVAPGLFPSPHRFAERFVRPIERELDVSLLGTLRRRIRPLMMRRTKELVAPELPAKQEQVLQIDLAPAHRHLYDTMLQKERQKLLGLIEDLDRNRFIVFRSLTLLRMLSLDASLVDPEYADIPSSKLDALLEQLDDVVAEGHRSLVFSQFTSFLQKAAARLDAAGIAYEYLDGSSRKRPEIIKRFQMGEAPVFLISLKAGGFGLNLTQADYVFLLDPWWNPASESQAIDRTHRIGQTGNVMVYRLVASDTIEEKVMALKARKSKLFDAVLDDDAVFSQALTAEDIRGLLEA
ncbi:SNF2-related protein [Plantibacter sp. YIM 135347]|uniref:DEAD/DEAH box helicase n=1 Tax=Plantibacter sp. YIM 135347 TaxID=3423919 RepID=UPI003D358116